MMFQIHLNTNYELNPLYANAVPPMSEDEYEALKESIRETGLQQPILVDEHNFVLDGHHRLRACEELGIEVEAIPYDGEKLGNSDDAKLRIAIEANVKRRQMSREAKNELMVKLARLGLSNKEIAAAAERSESTVRRAMRAAGLTNQKHTTVRDTVAHEQQTGQMTGSPDITRAEETQDDRIIRDAREQASHGDLPSDTGEAGEDVLGVDGVPVTGGPTGGGQAASILCGGEDASGGGECVTTTNSGLKRNSPTRTIIVSGIHQLGRMERCTPEEFAGLLLPGERVVYRRYIGEALAYLTRLNELLAEQRSDQHTEENACA